MTILLVSTASNTLTSFKLNDKGQRLSIAHVVDKIVDPLPPKIINDTKSDLITTTDWMVKHSKFNSLVYVLTSFGTKAKAVLTTFRVFKCGTLQHLSSTPSGGFQACHASLNPNGTCLAICHLHCGRISLFNVADEDSSGGCLGPPMKVVRLPVVYPYNLLLPHLSTTGLGVPAAHGVSFSPNGEFLCIAEPSQHAVVTYRCNASTGMLQTMEAYKQPTKGGGSSRLPVSNSAFSYVQTSTQFANESMTWCQSLAILMGGDFGPRVTRSVVHPNGQYLFALQEQTNSIATYELEHNGMIIPKLLQELKVAELTTTTSQQRMMCTSAAAAAASSSTTVSDLQAFEDCLILSISSNNTTENGVRIVHYVNGGSQLRLGQFIKTQFAVQHFVRDDDEKTLWLGGGGGAESSNSFVQKYQRRSSYDPTSDKYLFVGQSNVQVEVLCLATFDEVDLPEKQQQQHPSMERTKSKKGALNAEEARRKKLKQSFDKKDINKSGYLEAFEIAKVLEASGEPSGPEDVAAFMKQIDTKGDGKIDFEEFYAFAVGQMMNKQGSSSSTTGSVVAAKTAATKLATNARRKKLKASFDKKDLNGSGFLEADEIALVLAASGEPSSTEDVQAFIARIDQDGDGKINFEDFYAFATAQQQQKKKPPPTRVKDDSSVGGGRSSSRRNMLKKTLSSKSMHMRKSKRSGSPGSVASSSSSRSFRKKKSKDGESSDSKSVPKRWNAMKKSKSSRSGMRTTTTTASSAAMLTSSISSSTTASGSSSSSNRSQSPSGGAAATAGKKKNMIGSEVKKYRAAAITKSLSSKSLDAPESPPAAISKSFAAASLSKATTRVAPPPKDENMRTSLRKSVSSKTMRTFGDTTRSSQQRSAGRSSSPAGSASSKQSRSSSKMRRPGQLRKSLSSKSMTSSKIPLSPGAKSVTSVTSSSSSRIPPALQAVFLASAAGAEPDAKMALQVTQQAKTAGQDSAEQGAGSSSSSRVPPALQAVFLASQQGVDVSKDMAVQVAKESTASVVKTETAGQDSAEKHGVPDDKSVLTGATAQSRIPPALQAVFVASQQGEEVDKDMAEDVNKEAAALKEEDDNSTIATGATTSSRIPPALQAVFLASQQGQEVGKDMADEVVSEQIENLF